MRRNFILSLLIGMMGVIALSGCEKKHMTDYAKINDNENIAEYFVGQWKCTDIKYCIDDDKILLRFTTDSLYVDVNTKNRTTFPKGRFKYEFYMDTLHIFTEHYPWSYVYSINEDKNRMILNYTGTVMATANEELPSLIYNFRRIK